MSNDKELIDHHENGDSDFYFGVKMTVGATDDQNGHAITVGGIRFRIQSYYNEETRSNFFILEEGPYDTTIYGSPNFENKQSAIQWLINYIKGT